MTDGLGDVRRTRPANVAVASSDPFAADHADLRVELRILLVIDSRINLGWSVDRFGLGPLLRTLEEEFASWVRIRVDAATRDRDEDYDPFARIRRPTPDGRSIWSPILAGDRGDLLSGCHYYGFRFDRGAPFDIDDYDQVWLFGDHPGGDMDDDPDGDAIIDTFGLDDNELRVLASWMDRGGSVCATGDHGVLGASLSSRVPRVRSMRKWTHAQGVPRGYDATRNRTLQPSADPGLGPEQDGRPLPIELVDDAGSVTLFGTAPHPVLCGIDGAIDRFPDHMHEGEVIPDDDVLLDRPLDIDGYDGAEYPPTVPQVLAAVAPGSAPLPFLPRPTPRVIAFAQTTVDGEPSRRFGVVGVYDGEPAGVGRVVVDSTWHHWLSYNLMPLAELNPPVYASMQQYFRNVALWLARPQQRSWMLVGATWNALRHGAIRLGARIGPWQIGARVVDVLGRTAPHCIIADQIATFSPFDAFAAGPPPGEADQPTVRTVSYELLSRSVVGGIGAQLMPLAAPLMVDRLRGRASIVDLDTLEARGRRGVREGYARLTQVLDDWVSSAQWLRGQLASPEPA